MADTAADLSLFFTDRHDDPRWVDAELGAEIDQVKDAIGKLPDVAWGAVSEEVGEQIDGLLKVDFAEVLCAGWTKYRFLQQFRDKETYGPDETILVPLAKHKVKSLHHPTLDLMLNEVLLRRLKFEIDLQLLLEGVVLKVRDGRIREIKSGRCSGKGSFKCGKVTLMTKETATFDLPGRLKLGQGIEIPAAGAALH